MVVSFSYNETWTVSSATLRMPAISFRIGLVIIVEMTYRNTIQNLTSNLSLSWHQIPNSPHKLDPS